VKQCSFSFGVRFIHFPSSLFVITIPMIVGQNSTTRFGTVTVRFWLRLFSSGSNY